MPVIQKNEVTHLYLTGSWTRKYEDPQILRSVQIFLSPYEGYKHVVALHLCSFFCCCRFVCFTIGVVWVILSTLDSCKD